MEQRYYLDTCIWVDLHQDRKDYSLDFGEVAFKLLCKILMSKGKIIVSDFLLRELESSCTLEEIRGLAMPFVSIIIKVAVSEKQHEEAKMLSFQRGIPRGDAIHAIIARDNEAILVTRDKHFKILSDICESEKPEDLI